MISRQILLLLVVIFFISSPRQTTGQTFKDVAGEYIWSSGFTGSIVTLDTDGKYKKRYISDAQIYPTAEGTFTINQKVVSFIESKDVKKEEMYGNFEMYLIQWGDRHYLIDDTDIFNFAASVNFGIEPRLGIISRNYLTNGALLRKADEVKPVDGIALLPPEYNFLISGSQIKLIINSVGMREKHKLVNVSAGKSEGLRFGMCFAPKDGPIDSSTVLWVDSVEDHSAILVNKGFYGVPDYKAADILINKRLPPTTSK